MSRATAWAAVLVLALLGPGAAPAAGLPVLADPTDREPTVSFAPNAPPPGSALAVELSDWPPGVVAVMVCGQNAQRGSSDCALEASTTTTIGADGAGRARLVVAVPDVGCPCIVRATTLTGEVSAAAALTISGVVEAPRAADEPREPEDAAEGDPQLSASATVSRVSGPGQLVRSLVGAPVSYDLTVVVRNDGESTTGQLVLDVRWARNDLSGDTVARIQLSPIDPGDEAVGHASVDIGGPLIGHYVLHGARTGTSEPALFSADIESWPMVPLLVATLGASLVFWRRRPTAHPLLAAVATTALAGGLVAIGQALPT